MVSAWRRHNPALIQIKPTLCHFLHLDTTAPAVEVSLRQPFVSFVRHRFANFPGAR
jgi:hypothetical protein